ncbi:MAG: GIY-YIG nuclease family protein [Candidatus Pacebacteria bacterium]|nr:GIY-YIG nuclease family protein [Candidatus Paceibacterota bacterium]
MNLESFAKIKLPSKPGVYFFQKGKNILYIGKATELRSRVRSYFSNDLIVTRGPLLVDMVVSADKIMFQETDSVLEALILEASLIKKYQPYYNTKEKDDKSFNYVCITREDFPKVLVFRERSLKMNVYEEEHGIKFQAKYGPFTNGLQLREAMKIIRRIFPYIDVQSAKKDNAEFYRQIGLSPSVGNKEAKIAYDKNIQNLKLFFQGKKKRVISNFKKEMTLYAKNREFERAGEVKSRIFALMHINDIALLKNENLESTIGDSFRIEAYDIAHMSGKNMVGVMTVVSDGEVNKSEYKKFKIRTQAGANDVGALKEMLERRLAHTEWDYPSLIVVDGGIAQLNTTKKILKNLKLEIPLVSVVKDDRHRAKGIMGDKTFAVKYEREILLANSEAHRFAITYHKQMRGKNFLK